MLDDWDLNETILCILTALQNMSKVRYYGVTMLIDILRGSGSKRIFDNELDKIPEYGALKDMPRDVIQSIMEWMLKQKYILKTKEKYPVLHSTYEGLHYSETITTGKLKKLEEYLSGEDEVVLPFFSDAEGKKE